MPVRVRPRHNLNIQSGEILIRRRPDD